MPCSYVSVQNTLVTPLPFCAFNGGNDVFVDVGNKSLGLQCLMKYLGTQPQVSTRGKRAEERQGPCRGDNGGQAGARQGSLWG